MAAWLQLWILVGAATALTLSLRSLLQKVLSADHTSLELGFISTVIAAVLVLPLGLHAGADVGMPALPVLGGILFVGLMNTAGTYAFFRALQVADLSVASPLRQTLPIFVAVLEPAILSQAYRPGVLVGAVLAAAGGYITLAEGRHPLEPLTRLRGTGPMFAVASALLLAMGAIGAKYVVSRIPATLFVSLVFVVMAAAYTILLHHREAILPWHALLRRRYLVLGLLTGLSQLLIFVTIDLSTAAQATIMFRLAVLSNVVLGYYVLKEKHLGYRLAGSVLLLAGVAAAV